MRRLTKAGPIGGAADWSFWSSAANSGGSRSGIVASIWASFITGPLRPPSAEARSAAFFGSERSRPKSRAPAMRAATPPTLAPTRA